MSAKTPGLQELKNPVHLLALGFGAGCVPKLPGTAGTLVGVFLYLILQHLATLYYTGLLIILFILGIWICGRTARDLGVDDHPAIVYDEIVGYLVTMCMAPSGWQWMISGFLLFRLFDIWKPWPIRWLDRKVTGGFGVMLDDLVAGLFALVTLQLIHQMVYSL